MLIAKADRTDLLLLGSRDWGAQQADEIPRPSPDECLLVWRTTQSRLPDAIVVEDGGRQKFLAWTTTYIPQLTPITALVDVIEHQSFAPHQGTSPPSTDGALYRGCLGLVHAEVAAAYRGTVAPPAAGLTPFMSTLGWLALQQLATSRRLPLAKLADLWEEARQLLDARSVDYPPNHVEEVWALATPPSSGKGARQLDLQRVTLFLESAQSDNPALEEIPTARSHMEAFDALRSGPLESRVETFRRLSKSLYSERNAPATHALLLGFALSLISQGAFTHAGLLGPTRVSDMRPLLWYGFFEFYRRPPEAGSPAVAAASLQLLRTLREGHSCSRGRDIALDELRVLSRQKEPLVDCLLDARHPVKVEIVDGVVSLIRDRSTTPG
jgi:hypothetical protein